MGLFANSTSGLGYVSVSGRRRVPNPPTRMMAVNVVSSVYGEFQLAALTFHVGGGGGGGGGGICGGELKKLIDGSE